jgi:hypothetical protein
MDEHRPGSLRQMLARCAIGHASLRRPIQRRLSLVFVGHRDSDLHRCCDGHSSSEEVGDKGLHAQRSVTKCSSDDMINFQDAESTVDTSPDAL